MDGRWIKLTAAGLLAAAVGCSSTKQTTSGMTATLPGQGESRWARIFGPPKPPGPVTPPVVEVASSRKLPKPGKKGISPETDISFAKVQVDSAFLEGREANETDSLLDAARMRFQKVLNADPKNADALRGIAELYTRAGDRDKSIAAYQALVNAHPKDHKAAHEMALACARFDEWPAAASACEYALSIDPENRRYHRTYGKCLTWAGQHDRAVEVLAKVMPEAEARYLVAKVLFEGEQVDLGRQHLILAVQADPTFAPAQETLAKLNGTTPPVTGTNPVQQTGFDGPQGNK